MTRFEASHCDLTTSTERTSWESYPHADMASGSAVRNRSDIVTLVTPRGHVEVARQEMRGLRRGSGWRWFWVRVAAARQTGARRQPPAR
jgi:hypothetical protein